MTPDGPVVVLPTRPTPEALQTARRLAVEISCPLQSRRGRTIAALFREGYGPVIGVSGAEASLHFRPGEPPFRFHPGLAKNRVGGLLRGEPDTLVRAAGLTEGSTFLDATLGKATDAIVAAHAVGGAGRVLGVEAHPIVAALVRLGLESLSWPGWALTAAMRRVEVRQGHHTEVLRAEAEASWDVVYFDPFFDEQVPGSADMTPLRSVGQHGPVTEEALAEAQRVARLRVVHKVRVDHRTPQAIDGWELVRGKRRIGYRVWYRG